MTDLEALVDRLASTASVRLLRERMLFGNLHRLYTLERSHSYFLFCTIVDRQTFHQWRYNLVFTGGRLVIEVRLDPKTNEPTFALIRGDDHVLTLAALL